MQTSGIPRALGLIVTLVTVTTALAQTTDTYDTSSIPELVRWYTTDRDAIERFYNIRPSERSIERLETFLHEWQERLAGVDFDTLDRAGQVDYILLRREIEFSLLDLGHRREKTLEIAEAVPFADTIVALEETRRGLQPVSSEEAAGKLAEITDAIKALRKGVEKGFETQPADSTSQPTTDEAVEPLKLDAELAQRAADEVDTLTRILGGWFQSYDGYQPDFTWWNRKPYDEAKQALDDYAKLLRERVAGLKGEDDDPLVGDPIGRDELLDRLRYEMIPYTPEQLIAIAEQQFAWCEAEAAKATTELGFDDWHDALEHVKSLHVDPGEQDDLVARQAADILAFLDEHDLVTVPPLARETWRIEMADMQTQRTLPFAFYGGQYMGVAYAMEGMDYHQKLGSMRANNVHFTRIVTPHELIPGHHLQGFMAARYNTHRRVFHTPFLGEGWALYWEMLLWDRGYARGPEDRVGMLFWRMHRCARIIVSLKFHLGLMKPDEMIDFLVDRVGHERDAATSEVRRYVGSDYGPLYQCAYMIGGLQLRALHEDLVKNGRMTDREFHDAVLHQGPVPIEMIRAALTDVKLSRDYATQWRFAGDITPAVLSSSGD